MHQVVDRQHRRVPASLLARPRDGDKEPLGTRVVVEIDPRLDQRPHQHLAEAIAGKLEGRAGEFDFEVFYFKQILIPDDFQKFGFVQVRRLFEE